MSTLAKNKSTAEIEAALKSIKVIADAIKELGRVPSGTLYAALMAKGMTIETYTKLIDLLKRSQLIEEKNNELIWILE